VGVRLEVRGLHCGYGRRAVTHDVTLAVTSGEVLCLLGPNGSGKTTLFKTILGLLRPMAGTITIDGQDITRWDARRRARLIAYVPQLHTPSFPFRVLDVVIMGRTAHLGAFASPGRHDEEIARSALADAGIAHLADRPYTEISGGERQLVLITRALVQQAHLLIMDEPTSNLDYGNQVRVLRHIRRLAADGIAVLMTMHYPNHAFLCADRVALMHHGRIQAVGTPRDVITEHSLAELYGVATRIHFLRGDADGTAAVCVPQIPWEGTR
jgi:ABC-type cobalamin/Fe3+-siderophores transport system ATPase subunit